MSPHALAAACLALAASAPVAAHDHAHVHGLLRLDVAVDGDKLTVRLESPLDNLLGFEHVPKTDAERAAAERLQQQLRDAAALVATDAAAQCTVARADVGWNATKNGHADVDADYAFHCAQPAQLRTLKLGLFDAFKRLQRIEVRTVSARGQAKQTLKRPNATVTLAR